MVSGGALASEPNHMWYVYILERENKSLYTGITNNLERRYKEHLKKTAHYTAQ